jgi:hypothetical protein
MRPEESWQDSTSLNVSLERYRKVLTEYYNLARLPELNEAEAQRVYEILERAEEDEILSFLVNEIDELTYQELGLINSQAEAHLADEAAKVQECIPDIFSQQVLKPLVSARQYQLAPPTGHPYYSIPRVEMAFDSSHSDRVNLEKAFFSHDALICSSCGESHLLRNSRGSYKCLLCGNRMSLSSLLKEESVSILTSLCLLLFLLFMFF